MHAEYFTISSFLDENVYDELIRNYKDYLSEADRQRQVNSFLLIDKKYEQCIYIVYSM